MNLFEFITVGVHKIKRRGDSRVTFQQPAKGNAIVTFLVSAEAAIQGAQSASLLCGSAKQSSLYFSNVIIARMRRIFEVRGGFCSKGP